jgi:penicillin-binding protein 2
MSDSSRTIKPGQQKDYKRRILVFLGIIIFILSALFVKITYIQIIQYSQFLKQSESNREKIVRIPPIRGRIFSSDNQILASNYLTYDVSINNKELYSDNILRQKELLYLATVLNYDYSDIEKTIQNNKTKTEIIISENVSFDIVTKIKENIENMKGIEVKETMVREYPNKNVLSHVLGYIGPINSDELAMINKEEYKFYDLIGKNGIEKSYESELRGKDGKKVYDIDAKMNVQKEITAKEEKAQPGNEIVLTINLNLQKNVQDILADRTGAIVVMKPSSGEILAMASYPDFDPNIYVLQNDKNNELKRNIALDTKGTPLMNRAIQSIYPPGSIFKAVTATAILNENIVSLDQQYFCSGNFRLNKQNFGCWSVHGWENLSQAIMNSCDVYFYNVGLLTGIERISKYAEMYGFDKILGIDIPYESGGMIPSLEWKKSKGQIWYDGDTLNSVIGQGDVKVTPLQLANMMSVICNSGISYKPHLVEEIRSSINDKIIKKIQPEKIIDMKMDQKVFDFLINSLSKVTMDGTARGAFSTNKLKIAGKTGTAEIGMGEKKQTHSWFAGFGPLDYPHDQQIVVVVLCEYENNSYNRFAAPIASMTFSSYFMNEDYPTTAKRLYYPIKKSYNE